MDAWHLQLLVRCARVAAGMRLRDTKKIWLCMLVCNREHGHPLLAAVPAARRASCTPSCNGSPRPTIIQNDNIVCTKRT